MAVPDTLRPSRIRRLCSNEVCVCNRVKHIHSCVHSQHIQCDGCQELLILFPEKRHFTKLQECQFFLIRFVQPLVNLFRSSLRCLLRRIVSIGRVLYKLSSCLPSLSFLILRFFVVFHTASVLAGQLLHSQGTNRHFPSLPFWLWARSESFSALGKRWFWSFKYERSDPGPWRCARHE